MRVLLHDPSTRELRRGGEELLEGWDPASGSLAWIDFGTESLEIEHELLRERLGLHPLALQDANRARHPPKVEHFDGSLFLMLRELDTETSDIHFGYVGMSMFVGVNFLVTRSTGPSTSIGQLWRRLESASDEPVSSSGLALWLADQIVRRYLPILLDLEPRLDALESEMFENPSDSLLAELTRIKSSLKQLRRIFEYHAQLIQQLDRIPDLDLTNRYQHELIDVSDQVTRSASLAQLYYELAADLVDAYLGLSAHRLNQVMKVLTVITVIFVPLSFLAGIYGMNFENMPELNSRFGYYVLLSIMAFVVGVQVFLFRRKRWL